MLDELIGGYAGVLGAVAGREHRVRQTIDDPAAQVLGLLRERLPPAVWRRHAARVWRGKAPILDTFGLHFEAPTALLVADEDSWYLHEGDETKSGPITLLRAPLRAADRPPGARLARHHGRRTRAGAGLRAAAGHRVRSRRGARDPGPRRPDGLAVRRSRRRTPPCPPARGHTLWHVLQRWPRAAWPAPLRPAPSKPPNATCHPHARRACETTPRTAPSRDGPNRPRGPAGGRRAARGVLCSRALHPGAATTSVVSRSTHRPRRTA